MVALVWPGPTAFVLVIVVAAWALVGGVVEIVAGFGSGETAGTWQRTCGSAPLRAGGWAAVSSTLTYPVYTTSFPSSSSSDSALPVSSAAASSRWW